MDRSGLTSIEDTSSAGILPMSRDSPKFESEAQFPGNSPFQKPRTTAFRGFRGVRVHPAPRPACTGLISACPAIHRSRCRLAVPFGLKSRCRSARSVADPGVGSRPPRAPAHNRSAGPVPARKTRHGEPCNLALFSATGFLALSVPSFDRIRRRQKNGRFLGWTEAVQVPELLHHD